MKITIARALKLKNRLQSRIRTLAGDMEHYNSVVLGGSKEIDVKTALADYDRLVADLVVLKTAIFAANAPVYSQILSLAELKSKISVLQKLNTDHGKVVETYRFSSSDGPIEYEATFRKGEVDQMVRNLENEIDRVQEELDGHNHKNLIIIDSIEL